MSLHPIAAPTPSRLHAFSLAAWRYDPNGSRRDLRLDFLRGLFLCLMLIYHFHRSWLINYTYEFFGTTTAAEGFVFISGMVVCLVYFPVYQRNGFRAMLRKAWGRALRLYLADVVLLGALLLVHLFIVPLRPLDQISFGSPLQVLFNLITLRYMPFGFDILLLYILLLLLTPLILWLIHTHRTVWLVAGSVALYILYYLSPGTFEWHFVDKEIWRFPLMVWQVLFVGGILIIAYRPQLRAWWNSLPSRVPMLVVGILFLIFFAFRQLLDLDVISLGRATYNFWFDKPMLGVGRLLNFAVAALVVYWITDRFWEPFFRTVGKIFIPLGQASLYVFLMHIVLSYAYRSGVADILPFVRSGVYEILGILLLWFLVRQRFLFRVAPH